MRSVVTRVALAQLLCVVLCSGQANLNTYPIFWNAVAPESAAAVYGSNNLTGNCICDVTQFACDPSCCCDTYCPAYVVDATEAAGACLPPGPPQETLDYCVPKAYVQQVNLPSSSDFYSISIQDPNDKLFDQLLCIVSTSNPKLGNQYPDPPVGDVGNNANLAGCPELMSAPSRASSYVMNSPLFATRPGSSGSFPMTVPYPAFSMVCSDAYQPGFLVPLPATQKDVFSECSRSSQEMKLASLPSLCNATYGPLSALSYTSLSFLLLPSDETKTTKPVVQILYMDPMTGNLTSTTSSSSYYSSGMCHNALRYINITFVYQAVGSTDMALEQVQMSLVVTDISSSDTVFQQSVRIDFVQDMQDGASGTNGDRLVQQFSGNPGYLTGFPLLAGTGIEIVDPAQGNKTAIQRLIFGFPVPAGDPDGDCSPTALASARFGYNSSSTCRMLLNYTDLRDRVCKNSATYILQHILGTFFTNLTKDNVYVGIWGNSNLTTLKTDWFKVVQSNNAFPPPNFHNDTSTCDNIVVGFNVQVLYGLAYASNNAQKKVVYVNVCYRTQSWTFPRNVDRSINVPFLMTSTVSYIRMPQTPNVDQKKPTPPLAWPLPADIFYPFVTSAAVRASPSLYGLLAALLSYALVFLFIC